MLQCVRTVCVRKCVCVCMRVRLRVCGGLYLCWATMCVQDWKERGGGWSVFDFFGFPHIRFLPVCCNALCCPLPPTPSFPLLPPPLPLSFSLCLPPSLPPSHLLFLPSSFPSSLPYSSLPRPLHPSPAPSPSCPLLASALFSLVLSFSHSLPFLSPATHCNTLQHTATHCNSFSHSLPFLSPSFSHTQCMWGTSTASHCNTLQHTATQCNTRTQCMWGTTATPCNTLQHTATHYNTLQHTVTRAHSVCGVNLLCPTFYHNTHCNTLHHILTHRDTFCLTATHCDTLQHTASHCNTLHHTASHCITFHHILTHCNPLQHTATRCNTLQHTQCMGSASTLPRFLRCAP